MSNIKFSKYDCIFAIAKNDINLLNKIIKNVRLNQINNLNECFINVGNKCPKDKINERIEIINLFLEKGCDINYCSKPDFHDYSQTPLIFAIKNLFLSYYDNISIIKHLLKCGANPNIYGIFYRKKLIPNSTKFKTIKKMCSPLGCACLLNNNHKHTIIKLLLDCGAKIDDCKDINICCALESQNKFMIKHFLSKLDSIVENINDNYNDDNIDDYHKIDNIINIALNYWTTYSKKIIYDLRFKKFYDYENEYGDVPLLKSIINENFKYAEFLLANGVNINKRYLNGRTVLQDVCLDNGNNNIKGVKFLLLHGANFEDCSNTKYDNLIANFAFDPLLYCLKNVGANIDPESIINIVDMIEFNNE